MKKLSLYLILIIGLTLSPAGQSSFISKLEFHPEAQNGDDPCHMIVLNASRFRLIILGPDVQSVGKVLNVEGYNMLHSFPIEVEPQSQINSEIILGFAGVQFIPVRHGFTPCL